jgi:hypothetical protein
MFLQHSHLIPASFSSELPCLDSITILFWAQEGLKALEMSDGIETKHIIQFIPIKDLDAVEDVLRSRWDLELDALLTVERMACPSETSLTQKQTPAQELITLLLPPPGHIWPTTWVPPNPAVESPLAVAENIHDTVINTFYKIGFRDWVRYAFGIEVPAAMGWLQWASNVSRLLRMRYATQSKEPYMQVEKVCCTIAG